MSPAEMKKLLCEKSDEWREGFFFAVNLLPEMKWRFISTFMIGEEVTVSERSPNITPGAVTAND